MKKNPTYELSQEYVVIAYIGLTAIIVACLYFLKFSLISIAIVGYIILFFTRQTRKVEVTEETVIFNNFIGKTKLPISDILTIDEGPTQFHIKHKGGKISLDNSISNLSGLKNTLSNLKPDIKEDENSLIAQATSHPILFTITTLIRVVLVTLLVVGIYIQFYVN